jgi:hypothetical protein
MECSDMAEVELVETTSIGSRRACRKLPGIRSPRERLGSVVRYSLRCSFSASHCLFSCMRRRCLSLRFGLSQVPNVRK